MIRFLKSVFCQQTSATMATSTTPIIEHVARLARQAFQFGIDDRRLPSDTLNQLKATVAAVRAADVGLVPPNAQQRMWTPESQHPPVTYTEIHEDDTFTLGIFALKRGARIPLHDHPEMIGIIKVLYGTVRVQSYTRLGPADDDSLVAVSKSAHLSADADSAPVCLTPLVDNYHEIRAVDGPAAFLDVLAPPYDPPQRDCRFYMEDGTADLNHGSNSEPDTCVLREVEQPYDYWSDSTPYRGPAFRL